MIELPRDRKDFEIWAYQVMCAGIVLLPVLVLLAILLSP